MSRLGKLPIKLPVGTQAKIESGFIIVKGPKGELKEKTHDLVNIDINKEEAVVSVKDSKNKKERALWGLYRSLINNMVQGVNQDFEKKLEVVGVGYRVSLSGKKLTLNVGYSHPVNIDLPDGINAEVEGNNITISGISKQQVGEIAAQIRKIKKPEPYKGKGIRYHDEIIRRKEGKTAVKGE